MVVLVTGASGQLGQVLQSIANQYAEINLKFFDSKTLNITDLEHCKTIFEKVNPDYCINAAAYTAVDKAESEPDLARLVNTEGPRNLAKICKELAVVLVHISTDFVFDGNAHEPYTEEDLPNPTGVYGQTKLDGEKAIQSIFSNYFIIRTSWVYSKYGSNFLKTMLRLSTEKTSLSVVDDQIGTPTNAVDLAKALLKIITVHTSAKSNNYGVYNFSNGGKCSWYDFSKKIFEVYNIEIDLQPIPTASYPTPAKRPAYSVLDKNKIKTVFDIEIREWNKSLNLNYRDC